MGAGHVGRTTGWSVLESRSHHENPATPKRAAREHGSVEVVLPERVGHLENGARRHERVENGLGHFDRLVEEPRFRMQLHHPADPAQGRRHGGFPVGRQALPVIGCEG